MNKRVAKALHLKGGGIWDAFMRFVKGPRKDAPPKVRKFMQEYGGKKVVDIKVGRTPLDGLVTSYVDAVTDGDLVKNKEKKGVKDLYHSFLVVTTEDGKTFKVEKNATVNVEPYRASANDQLLPVQLNQSVNVQQLLDRGQAYQKKTPQRGNFWQYDPTNNNCQYFVDDIIQGNPEIANKQQVNQFAFQGDAPELVKGHEEKLSFITNLAQRFDHAWNGEGIGKKRKRPT